MLKGTPLDHLKRAGRAARSIACAAALLCIPTSASADGPMDSDSAAKAAAFDLFQQAKALMDQKQYDQACPKLEESYRLDPGGGTLLNLAFCHELQGKIATAWVEFGEALRIARLNEREDRVSFANEHLALLRGRLSRIQLRVPPESRAPGMELRVNGVPIGPAAWGSGIPVNPGETTISVSAPGKLPWSKVVVVKDPGTQTVDVPLLQPDPKAADANPAPRPAPEQGRPANQASAPGETRAPGSDTRVAGLVVGAGGIAALATGGYFGLLALSRKKDSDDRCPSDSTCSPAGVSLNDSAGKAADVATVMSAIGVVGIGIGSYLYFTSSPTRKTARVQAVPAVSHNSGGVWLSGAW